VNLRNNILLTCTSLVDIVPPFFGCRRIKQALITMLAAIITATAIMVHVAFSLIHCKFCMLHAQRFSHQMAALLVVFLCFLDFVQSANSPLEENLATFPLM